MDENSRSKCPRVRLIGGRIYDSENGKSCHQCRQKTRDFTAQCKNQKGKKMCSINFCHKCLLNRYGEKAADVALLKEWSCPKCRDICNCSVCMKKQGHKPTGILVHAAKGYGFSSVSDMLKVNGPEIPKRQSSSDKEPVAVLCRKRVNENSFDGDTNVGSQEKLVIVNESHSDKTEQGGLKEISNNIVDDNGALRKSRAKKPNICEEGNKMEVKTSEKDGGECEEKKNSETQILKASSLDVGQNEERNRGTKILVSAVEFENEKFDAKIQLPQGCRLTIVEDVLLPPEDVGHALQFLEFCSSFGKVLNLKKGNAGIIIKEIAHGQSGRRSQYSILPWIHIQLLSLILKDKGEKCKSPCQTKGQHPWVQALGKLVSENPCMSSEFPSDCFNSGIDGYGKLNITKKFKLLNFLCDEALSTECLRKVIDDQNSKFLLGEKEAKEKVSVAKKKKKWLKQKIQDELAKAIMAKTGAYLSVSDHEALVSEIKRKAAEAHMDMLEAKGMAPKMGQRSDAVRTEPILLDANGSLLWKLKCYTREPNILLQDMGTLDSDAHDEKWFSYDADQKEEIEKCISSLKRKWAGCSGRRSAG